MATKILGAHKDASPTRGSINRTTADNESKSIRITVQPAGHVKACCDKMTAHFRASVEASVTSKQKKGLPVARYDAISKKAYLEYPDGRKKYIDKNEFKTPNKRLLFTSVAVVKRFR